MSFGDAVFSVLRVALRLYDATLFLVHRLHMPLQTARVPEHSGTVRACEVAPFLVHRLHTRLQAVRMQNKRTGKLAYILRHWQWQSAVRVQ